ncbi:MAG: alpha/beta hydrolase [Candidatus Eremiobacteraeota bacterium]|nr:alpha/beta hydrolase [Candidatus Eremiobacteraeota bacterium]MBC5827320.1 alpha/beta hydrolase [Candidatus Eremiobacteraeota bacterium]
MAKQRCVLLALCVVMLAPFAVAGAQSPPLGLNLAPCTEGHAKAPAECGTFGARENPALRSGRVIALRLVVLKAKHASHRAIAFIAGGPGESAVVFAPILADGLFARHIAKLRDSYDILFVDNRGMGGSNPSRCDFAPAADPVAYFSQLWPDKLVTTCRDKYAAKSNLSLYNTDNAVDDLDGVRAALGYPKLVLNGGSYGTFFSLVYMRRHPERVESALLDGVAPPHFQPLPGAPDGAQTALNDLIVKCRLDAICNNRFPFFGQHFNALVQLLNRGPIAVKVWKSKDKSWQTVPLSKEVFVDRVRDTLYDPESAAYLPYIVERASRADFVPLGKLIKVQSTSMAQDVDQGAYLSYSCAEFMPFISPDELKAAAAHSFAGDLRVRAQRRSCSSWNVPPKPPSFNDPVESQAPVLMVSGSDDPATPARYAAAALRYLPNAKQVLVRGAGHATETPCTDGLMVRFVRDRSAKGLNVSQCSAAFTPPRFATSMAGWPDI